MVGRRGERGGGGLALPEKSGKAAGETPGPFPFAAFFFLYRTLVFFIVKSVCLFRFIVLLYVYCK